MCGPLMFCSRGESAPKRLQLLGMVVEVVGHHAEEAADSVLPEPRVVDFLVHLVVPDLSDDLHQESMGAASFGYGGIHTLEGDAGGDRPGNTNSSGDARPEERPGTCDMLRDFAGAPGGFTAGGARGLFLPDGAGLCQFSDVGIEGLSD